MPFKPSRCVCLQVPDPHRAASFYRDRLGLQEAAPQELVAADREGEVADRERATPFDAPGVELVAGPWRLFLDRGPALGPILEFLVPDVEAARQELVAAGCEVVRWEGRGGCCYLRDPFGLVFNLFEDPGAFA